MSQQSIKGFTAAGLPYGTTVKLGQELAYSNCDVLV